MTDTLVPKHDRTAARYTVHLYTLVRVKLTGIEAGSEREAIRKAEAAVDLHRLFDRDHPVPNVEHTEWSEATPEALVDHDGDLDFEHSTWWRLDKGEWVENTDPPEPGLVAEHSVRDDVEGDGNER